MMVVPLARRGESVMFNGLASGIQLQDGGLPIIASLN